ncbi:MAG: electron transfer flavoprotein subunit alpha/FixB family protein [Deferrisomatales bacterium]|nr:electron transfer flavoprotein subunit alpha/FixB family protein [Deferrisomatales bacterium]
MSPATGEFLVYAPFPEGELDEAGKGILAESGKLAQALKAPWRAVCLPPPDPAAYAPFGAYGVPEILEIASGEPLADYPEALADAVAGAARHVGAACVLLAHTDAGSALAPLVAARLGAALFTEALAFEPLAEGLRLTRRVLGPRVAEHRVWADGTPLVLTVLPQALGAVVLPSMAPSEPRRVSWAFEALAGAKRVRVVERIPPDPQTVDVSEAEVIFCAGKGLDRETYERLRELSRLLHASLGVTRPVYDQGFAGFERMIGQTGKTVTPRFYLGVGISGSMHHVGGVKDSRAIVSLNVDPKAPLFPNSDEGFVADAREVLPRLLELVRTAAGGAR